MPNLLEPIIILSVGGLLSLKFLALWSHTRCAARGIIDGKLAPNNHSPNSVCSEGETANIAPLAANGTKSWEMLQDAVEELSGRFIVTQENYFHAVFRTPILGFEDDLEARFDRETQRIHLRSASRVGYSDMGTNQKRIDALRRLIES